MLYWHLTFPEWVVLMSDHNQPFDMILAPPPPCCVYSTVELLGDGVWAAVVACCSTQGGVHYCDYRFDSSTERWERQTQPIILISAFFSQKTAASSSYIPQLSPPPELSKLGIKTAKTPGGVTFSCITYCFMFWISFPVTFLTSEVTTSTWDYSSSIFVKSKNAAAASVIPCRISVPFLPSFISLTMWFTEINNSSHVQQRKRKDFRVEELTCYET